MRKWTDEQLLEVYPSCRSVRQILEKLGLKAAGGNYSFVQERMKALGLEKPCPDRSWNRGMKLGPMKSTREYLVDGSKISSHDLRLRLIRDGYKEHRCENCGLTEWLSKPIPLELDHKDGQHTNNQLENLQILCPNCHALTENYRGKNIGKVKSSSPGGVIG